MKKNIVWICIILLVIFIFYYTNNLYVSRNNPQEYINNFISDMPNNETNIWYGLNSSGTYRGYGREYGGIYTPNNVYGYTKQCN
jgi:heme/copper-type cytochrome/quinol oxidase subunit 2